MLDLCSQSLTKTAFPPSVILCHVNVIPLMFDTHLYLHASLTREKYELSELYKKRNYISEAEERWIGMYDSRRYEIQGIRTGQVNVILRSD